MVPESQCRTPNLISPVELTRCDTRYVGYNDRDRTENHLPPDRVNDHPHRDRLVLRFDNFKGSGVTLTPLAGQAHR